MKRILVIIITIVGLSIPTMAQRLLPHQKGIEFYGGVPLQKHNTFGDGNFNAGLNFTRYIRNLHIPEHTRSLSGSLLGYKTIP